MLSWQYPGSVSKYKRHVVRFSTTNAQHSILPLTRDAQSSGHVAIELRLVMVDAFIGHVCSTNVTSESHAPAKHDVDKSFCGI